jgi:hypothetical protein
LKMFVNIYVMGLFKKSSIFKLTMRIEKTRSFIIMKGYK